MFQFLRNHVWEWLCERVPEREPASLSDHVEDLPQPAEGLSQPCPTALLEGQPSIPTCLLPKDTSNDSFFTVKKRDTRNTSAE